MMPVVVVECVLPVAVLTNRLTLVLMLAMIMMAVMMMMMITTQNETF